MSSRQSWKAAGLMLAPLLVLLARPARAADTLVTFEEFPAGTAISTQYAGVTFNGSGTMGAHISTGDVTGHNGSNNVLIVSPLANTNGRGPLTITFNPPVQTVTLWAGYLEVPGGPTVPGGATSLQGTLTAFDQSGAPVPSATVTGLVNGAQASSPLSVASTQANIGSVTLSLGQGVFTVIDDLDFSGAITTPPPGGAPMVTLAAPVNPSTIDITNSSQSISGTVSGQDVLANVVVTLQPQFTNSSTQAAPAAPLFSTSLPLNATSTANLATFASSSVFSNKPIGIYILTVTATNKEGQTGVASAVLNNFPSGVDLFPSEFQFFVNTASGECQFIAYNDTAKDQVFAFFPATGNVIPVDVPVFRKWQNVNDPIVLRGGDGTLGCPVLGEISHFESKAMAGSLAFNYKYKIAPFEHGSIYWVSTANETETIPGTVVYTPKVFTNAINNLGFYGTDTVPPPVSDDGGIDEVGIPVKDPTYDLSDQEPTFVFQQFFRPWYVNRDVNGNVVENPVDHTVTPGIFNTLEIRGPFPNPTLYVERIGGSLLDFQAGFGAGSGFPRSATCKGEAGTGVCNVPVPGDLTPTIWESGVCTVNPTSQAFNCTVDHPHVQAFTSKTNTPVYSTTTSVPDDSGYCNSDDTCQICLGVGLTLQQTTEWSAIPGKASPSTDTGTPGDGIDIQATGWVVASNAANTDVPATHQNMQGSAKLSDTLGTAGGCLVGLLGGPAGVVIGCGLGAITGYQLGGMFGLWSDYGIHVRPLALSAIPDPNSQWVLTPSTGILPVYWNLMASNGDPTLEGSSASPIGAMEMEWEEFWDHPWFGVSGGPPPIGSLLFANGRWIIDCGHTPVHSEIHPPNSVMYAVMTPEATNPFAENVATTAQMWVNEFYLGNLYKTQVWPPPRPTPTAQMNGILATAGTPTAGPMITNIDGSHTFAFAPSQNYPSTSGVAQATVVQTPSGLLIEVQGPLTSHGLAPTGQLLYPDDFVNQVGGGGGPISNLYATWTVGWNCQSVNGQSNCP